MSTTVKICDLLGRQEDYSRFPIRDDGSQNNAHFIYELLGTLVEV